MAKYYFVFLILGFSLSLHSYSQATEPLDIKKWTIKSIVMSKPYTFERSNPLPSFFTGIGTKLNYQKIAYRFSYEQFNYVKEIPSLFQKGSFKENTLRLGAEYKMRYYEVINLNLFLDFGLTKINQETVDNNLDSNLLVTKKFDGYAVGAIFGIGFDYFFTPSFSVVLETRLDLIHSAGDYHEEDYFNKYTVNYVTTDTKFNLNILGNVSLNYHF